MNELVDKTTQEFVEKAKITQTVVHFPGEIIAPNIVAGPTIGGGGQTIGQEILYTKHTDKKSLEEIAKARMIYLPHATFRHLVSLIKKRHSELTATPILVNNNKDTILNDILPAISYLDSRLKPTTPIHNTKELRKAIKNSYIFLRRLKVMKDKNKREQFKTEYDVLDEIVCERVPRVHEFGESNKGIWYVSDFCDAKTFKQILAEKMRLAEPKDDSGETIKQMLAEKAMKEPEKYIGAVKKMLAEKAKNPATFLKPAELYSALLQMISTAVKIKNQISPEQYEELKIDDDYNEGNHLFGLDGKIYFADPICSTETAKETQGIMSPEDILNAARGKRKYRRESVAFKIAYLAYFLANKAYPFSGSDEALYLNIMKAPPAPFSKQHNHLYGARQERNLLLPFEKDPSKRISLEDWYAIIREDFEDIAGYNAVPEETLRKALTGKMEEERASFYTKNKNESSQESGSSLLHGAD